MSYIVITVWELLIRTIYLYQTPAVFLMYLPKVLDTNCPPKAYVCLGGGDH